MNLLYAIFFGAGVAAFVYTQMGKRIGYGNSQSVWTITLVTFVIASIIFFTIITTFISLQQ
jgi:hypothetical protein